MPELPEVEVIKKELKPVEGLKIRKTRGSDEKLFSSPLAPGNVGEYLTGKILRVLERYGKYLLMGIEDNWLIFHPRMSGKIWFQEEPPAEPDRVKLVLEFSGRDTKRLYFTSMRRFSRFYWAENKNYRNHEKLKSLGPDPLKDNYTRRSFESAFKGRRARLKSLLLDQTFLAGIGNIYASEICFDVQIDPRRRPDEIGEESRTRLYRAIPRILQEAVAAGGSSLQPEVSATTYRNTSGNTGNFAQQHLVYGREGKKCQKCSDRIKKIELANRSTYFCPTCQK